MVFNFLSFVDHELHCWNRISHDRCVRVEVVSTVDFRTSRFLWCLLIRNKVIYILLYYHTASPNPSSSCTGDFQLIVLYCYSVGCSHTFTALHDNIYKSLCLNVQTVLKSHPPHNNENIHTCVYTHTYMRTHIHICVHTYRHMCTHTCRHTHTHTHSAKCIYILSGISQSLRNVPPLSQVAQFSVRTPLCSDFTQELLPSVG